MSLQPDQWIREHGRWWNLSYCDLKETGAGLAVRHVDGTSELLDDTRRFRRMNGANNMSAWTWRDNLVDLDDAEYDIRPATQAARSFGIVGSTGKQTRVETVDPARSQIVTFPPELPATCAWCGQVIDPAAVDVRQAKDGDHTVWVAEHDCGWNLYEDPALANRIRFEP